MSDRDGLQEAMKAIAAKALVWRQQAPHPWSRAEADLAGAVDTYLAEISKFTGHDVSGMFKP